MTFRGDDPVHTEAKTPAVRGDLYGTPVEWPERQPMSSDLFAQAVSIGLSKGLSADEAVEKAQAFLEEPSR